MCSVVVSASNEGLEATIAVSLNTTTTKRPKITRRTSNVHTTLTFISRLDKIYLTLTLTHLTQRFSSADFPAAIAMMRAIRPSSPEHGEGLSFTRQSQKARVSWMYA